LFHVEILFFVSVFPYQELYLKTHEDIQEKKDVCFKRDISFVATEEIQELDVLVSSTEHRAVLYGEQ